MKSTFARLSRYPGLQRERCLYCGEAVYSLPEHSRLAAHIARAHAGGECPQCTRTMSALHDTGLCAACQDDMGEAAS